MTNKLIAAAAGVLALAAQLTPAFACSSGAAASGRSLPAAVAAATTGAGRCAAGLHWQDAHYNHLAQYEAGHCVPG